MMTLSVVVQRCQQFPEETEDNVGDITSLIRDLLTGAVGFGRITSPIHQLHSSTDSGIDFLDFKNIQLFPKI